MRSKRAIQNIIATLLLQVTVFCSGLLLPRFFLQAYGSVVNGMIISITQVLAYLSLAEAGISAASIVDLYKPLAKKDSSAVNGVLVATKKFYYKAGILFAVLSIVLAVIYPRFIGSQVESTTATLMVLILASSITVDFVLIGKYRVLLTADQKGYVFSMVQALGTIVTMVVTIVLIFGNCNVLFVKLVVTIVYIFRFCILSMYTKKNYPKISFNGEASEGVLTQKNDALLHQIVGVIVNNTDVLLITIFMGAKSLLEVSVYGIYNLVVYAINQLLTSFSSGLLSGFGEMIAEKKPSLSENYSIFETVYFTITAIVCSTVIALFIPFIGIYTESVADINYIRPITALLFTIIIYLQNMRVPALTMVSAAGHFKETRSPAIREAIINLSVSLLLVGKYGINGVLIGTICSFLYRTINLICYNQQNIITDKSHLSWKRIIRVTVVTLFLSLLGIFFTPTTIESFTIWAMYGCVLVLINTLFCIFVTYWFDREISLLALHKFISVINKRRRG